jgi:virulence-associated protein VagC
MITKVFKSGNSMAVRIPSSIKIEGTEVEILDLGDKGILLSPLSTPKDPWDLFREGVEELKGDWPDRDQPTSQKREVW